MRILRVLFQILAFGVFVFQMQNSVLKYIARPIVEQTSTIPYDSITQPIIYVCQDNQINFLSAKEVGYATKTMFASGITSDGKLTWTGKNGNQTFEDLVKLLFEADYESFKFVASEKLIDGSKRVGAEKVFLYPYGFCMKLLHTNKTVMIVSSYKTLFLLIDPARSNNLSLNYMSVYMGEFGPSGNNTFQGYNYEVKIQLHNHKILDGETCTDYNKLGSSYGGCLRDKMQESFLNWYGCTPPWIQKKNQTCDIDKAIQDPSLKFIYEEVEIKMRRFIKGLKTKIFAKCLLPCQSMSMELTKLYHLSNRINTGYVLLDMNPNVAVHTDVAAYDTFSLIVDLGSALGLWLGLSALSIFDSILQAYGISKQKLSKIIHSRKNTQMYP